MRARARAGLPVGRADHARGGGSGSCSPRASRSSCRPGWWLLAVALWPADSRPYIGGSTDNSPLELAFGYNGLGRIFGGQGNGGAGRTSGGAEMAGGPSPAAPAAGRLGGMPPGGGPGGGGHGRLRRPGRAHPAVQRRDRRPDLLAAARGADPAGRRRCGSPAARRGRTACAPRCCCGAAGRVVSALVFSLMAGHLPRLLHGGAGARDRRAGRDRRPRGLAGPRHLDRPGRPRRRPRRSRPSGRGCCSAARRRSCPGCAGWCSRSASSPRSGCWSRPEWRARRVAAVVAGAALLAGLAGPDGLRRADDRDPAPAAAS